MNMNADTPGDESRGARSTLRRSQRPSQVPTPNLLTPVAPPKEKVAKKKKPSLDASEKCAFLRSYFLDYLSFFLSFKRVFFSLFMSEMRRAAAALFRNRACVFIWKSRDYIGFYFVLSPCFDGINGRCTLLWITLLDFHVFTLSTGSFVQILSVELEGQRRRSRRKRAARHRSRRKKRTAAARASTSLRLKRFPLVSHCLFLRISIIIRSFEIILKQTWIRSEIFEMLHSSCIEIHGVWILHIRW